MSKRQNRRGVRSWSCPFIGPGGRFYDGCAFLAHCLSQVGPAEKIHEFARRSEQIGINLALQEVYGIAGTTELERLWRKSLVSQATFSPAHYSHIKKRK